MGLFFSLEAKVFPLKRKFLLNFAASMLKFPFASIEIKISRKTLSVINKRPDFIITLTVPAVPFGIKTHPFIILLCDWLKMLLFWYVWHFRLVADFRTKIPYIYPPEEPQPSVNCSRANGFFPWPANMSCQHFWDCRQGKPSFFV